jgi:hypothetical protein
LGWYKLQDWRPPCWIYALDQARSIWRRCGAFSGHFLLSRIFTWACRQVVKIYITMLNNPDCWLVIFRVSLLARA